MNTNNSTDKKRIEVESHIKHFYRTVSAIEDQLKLIKDSQLEVMHKINTITYYLMKIHKLNAMQYYKDNPENNPENNS